LTGFIRPSSLLSPRRSQRIGFKVCPCEQSARTNGTLESAYICVYTSVYTHTHTHTHARARARARVISRTETERERGENSRMKQKLVSLYKTIGGSSDRDVRNVSERSGESDWERKRENV